jgi:hypothetical protein
MMVHGLVRAPQMSTERLISEMRFHFAQEEQYIKLLNLENTHLNKLMKLTLISYLFISMPLLANPNYNVADVNLKIEALVASKSHITNSALDVEDRNSNPDFLALKNLALTFWSQMVENIELLAQGNDGKGLMIEALQVLEPVDYMSAFEKLVLKFEADTLSKELISNAVLPNGRMTTFFAYNFQHPRVISSLGKIKNKLPSQDPLIEILNDILSGQRRASYEAYKQAHEGTSEPVKPIFMLPPS